MRSELGAKIMFTLLRLPGRAPAVDLHLLLRCMADKRVLQFGCNDVVVRYTQFRAIHRSSRRSCVCVKICKPVE